MYLKMGNIEKASECFLKAMQVATATSDSATLGIAGSNYGNCLRLKGKYEELLPYFYFDIARNKTAEPENTAITCVYLANSLLHLDSIEKANFYLEYSVELGPDWEWSNFPSIYYETRSLYYTKKGNYRSAFIYLDSLLQHRDKKAKGNNLSVFKSISLRFAEEKRQALQKQRILEANNLRLTRNIIIGVLVVLFSTALGVLLRKRRTERQHYAATQQQAEDRLQKAENELEQYISTVKEKNKLIEQIEARLAEDRGLARGGEEVTLQHLQSIALSTEEDWLRFKTLFTAVWPGFFEDLSNRYPALNQGEMRLLSLCKLEFSSKEMATMLGISPESLRKSRYRLRKKLPELLQEEDFKDRL